MTTVNCYLSFNGNCEEAFNFYKSVFGGNFSSLERYGSMPGEHPMPESEKNKILHVSLPISAETVLMGADTSEMMGKPAVFGDNFSLSVNTDSDEEAKRIFNALAEKGKVIMPLEKAFWGALFGFCVDRFGIQWMVSHEYQK